MRSEFAASLRCPACGSVLDLEAKAREGGVTAEGTLRSPCGRTFPVTGGVPRLLPDQAGQDSLSRRTQALFGDEWQRFPELLRVHAGIFRWYFEGDGGVAWPGLRVLDAGCGMGRWLHFAREGGAHVVGMDVSAAVDVAASRESGADFVQADLRQPPFPPASFDLVYSLGVVHHVADPVAAVRSLAALVRPGGTLRLYVYRSLADEGLARRALLAVVTALRGVTTRLPPDALHAFSWVVAATATAVLLTPRRVLRRSKVGDRLTRGLPLVQYADVPFRMLVAEQFDRFGAPLEGRYRRDEVEGWLRAAGLDVVAILPGLGWRAIARKPAAASG